MRSANSSFTLRRNLSVWITASLLLLLQSAIFAQVSPLRISPPAAQRVATGKPFQVRLQAEGGTAPYKWHFSATQVPAGLNIDPSSGLVSGALKSAGEFRIPVTVTDSSDPVQQATATLVITVVSSVEVRWVQKPQVANGGISGIVEVENNSGETLQMTVIVLAVNPIGKAFALGYQHFDLANGTKSPQITFGSTLPYDSYTLHVDAVGEDMSNNRIYRSRLETERIAVSHP